MRHRRPDPFVLLTSCSYCKKSFEDGRARHMLGSYPMEQFCTYQCAENYLENDLAHTLPVTPMVYGREQMRRLKKGVEHP